MPLSWKQYYSGLSQRWVFTILASLALCIQCLYSIVMSITIIEMIVPTNSSLKEEGKGSCTSTNSDSLTNRTVYIPEIKNDLSSERYFWDEYTQGIILSSFFWSNTVSLFISGPLAERFGGKYLLGIGSLVQAVIAFLTPLLTKWGGSTALIITRVLTGLVAGGIYPISSTMISKWTTESDRTVIGNTIYAGSVVGLFFGTIVPVVIMKNLMMGWPAVFYFLGSLGLLWFPFWHMFVYDSPEVHPYISKEELAELKSDESKVISNLPPTPWKEVFSCKEFWAFTISLNGLNWNYFLMVSDLPKYMGDVLKFSLESNGNLSSLPYIFMWLNSILSAWINDKILEKQWLTLTNTRKLLATISCTGACTFILLASYAECNKTIVVIMFSIGITLLGSYYTSLLMNPLDLSPNYAGSIMSAGSGIASVVGFLVPCLVGLIAPHSYLTEWRVVFWMVFSITVISNAVYLAWFKAEVQPWNDPNFVRCKTNITDVKKEITMEVIS